MGKPPSAQVNVSCKIVFPDLCLRLHDSDLATAPSVVLDRLCVSGHARVAVRLCSVATFSKAQAVTLVGAGVGSALDGFLQGLLCLHWPVLPSFTSQLILELWKPSVWIHLKIPSAQPRHQGSPADV